MGGWVGGWVGGRGDVDLGWVGMSYCELGLGGWAEEDKAVGTSDCTR